MVKVDKKFFSFTGCRVEVASFIGDMEVAEYHLIFHPEQSDNSNDYSCCKAQMTSIVDGYKHLLASPEFSSLKLHFGRIFLKDFKQNFEVVSNFEPFFGIPLSIIGQTPLDGSSVTLWLYATNCDATHNGYEHIFSVKKCSKKVTPYSQTEEILDNYSEELSAKGCNMVDNCMRTWFFVGNVDFNYASFVKSRKDFFDNNGLTPETHYIASTGIEGKSSSIVSMDAYAVKGLSPLQISYLRGTSYLSPTIIYGVTFERGVAIQYGDRCHTLISGTASIDKRGNVVHQGNVHAQTLRTFDNIEVLLKEADASIRDIAMCIVYLRNDSDYPIVESLVHSILPGVPSVMVHAAVCRPLWLVEIECIAITPKGDERFRVL